MKKMKLAKKRSMITNFTKADNNFLALYGIYKDTIEPGIAYNMFVSMYCSEELMGIDFTLFTSAEKRAGFSAAFHYSTKLSGKPVYIIRSATGLKEEFQGKGMHDITDLYLKFIRFAVRHPFAPKYAAAFVINPVVFTQLCRFVPQLYPKPGTVVPENIERVMDEMAAKSHHERDPLHPYSVQVPIQVTFSASLLKRIYNSKDENIQWFILNAPHFLDHYGLLTIIHITWKNVLGTALHLTAYNISKIQRRFQRTTRRLKQKAAGIIRSIFQKWTL